MNYKKNVQSHGVGLNLRLENIDEILEQKPKLPFLEIIVDNWFSLGPHHKKLDKIRQDYNLSFHCVGMNICGADPIDIKYLETLKELKNKYQPMHISDHLCMTAHENCHHHDLLPFPHNEEYLKNAVDRVLYIQDYVQEQILIENLSFYIEYKSSEMTEIEFINKLMNKTDCLSLLDLNNIWVNEKNLNIKTKDYLENVQWERVKEIHLAGPEIVDGIYIDTHGTDMYPELIDMISNNSDKIKDKPILYERDNHLNGLVHLMNQKQIIEKAIYE